MHIAYGRECFMERFCHSRGSIKGVVRVFYFEEHQCRLHRVVGEPFAGHGDPCLVTRRLECCLCLQVQIGQDHYERNKYHEATNSEKSPLPLLTNPLALPFLVAMLAHHAREPVVDEFHPLGAELMVDTQEAAIDELAQQGLGECALV